MLAELIIRNFAIIDRLQVTFGPGFNVLTGETGAGKSIIIDAVGLLLGDRARPEVIRTGEDEATVEGLFDITGQDAFKAQLQEHGFEIEDELLLKRVVSRSGKNRIYVNGSLAKLLQLQQLTEKLVNIYGQHEHQSLQKTDSHLLLLDRFAGHQPLLVAYREQYHRLAELNNELAKLEEADRDRRQRLDFLRYQQREIAAAELAPGEDLELEQERKLLQHGEKLSQATGGGYQRLYGDKGAVCGTLQQVAGALASLAQVDPMLGELAETICNCQFSLEDVAVQLRDYAGKISFEAGRQDQVESRLAKLGQLKKKYGPSVEAILDCLVRIEQELTRLDDVAVTREGLLQRQSAITEQLNLAAAELSRSRQLAGRKLAEQVMHELADLAMPKARFEVRFFPLGKPENHGLERIEFYLSPNPGEELRPLAWIASGGELSRIMLALKRAAPDSRGVPTLIFDEVDAGIGGAAASVVGEKLKSVACGLQVLCITHLPQVAAFADSHYRVEKMEDGGRTFTALVQLKDDTRVLEMARMLGGTQVTERTLEHAREMISKSAVA
jgi:DNA repair protein RecN (Recombination protein N)